MPGTHQHVFREMTHAGMQVLAPCDSCGLSAAQAMQALDGDQLRAIVRRFLGEAEDISKTIPTTSELIERDKMTGQVLARDLLAKRLSVAGVDVSTAPAIREPVRPAGARTAAAVRALHVLETIDVGASQFSSCKADGYVTRDLTKDPCPTLKALNESDPPPAPPVVDMIGLKIGISAIVAGAVSDKVDNVAGAIIDWVNANEDLIEKALDTALRFKSKPAPPPEPKPVLLRAQLVAVIHAALNAALCNAGVPGWTLYEEAEKAADKLAESAPVLDLNSDALRKAILNAIASPTLYAKRDGDAVPGHQARAVIAQLGKVADA